MKNTEVVIHVKEQILIPNVKYIRLLLNILHRNLQKQIYLPNKDHLSGNRHERTYIAAWNSVMVTKFCSVNGIQFHYGTQILLCYTRLMEFYSITLHYLNLIMLPEVLYITGILLNYINKILLH